MSDLGNKAVMAHNIQYYMELHGKTRSEMCEALGVKYTTFTDWVKGNSYPRIDKIELMANYFGIKKSDLVESHPADKNNTIALTNLESAHIKKYRVLDDYGKKNVDTILDNEYDRCIQQSTPISFQDSGLRAAHNDDNNPDQLEKMQRDLARLEKLIKERKSHKE